jgi:Mitochondrial carrier protein
MQSEKPRAEWNYQNTVDCFKQIYKKEGGIPAFYKGAWANALRTVGSALVSTTTATATSAIIVAITVAAVTKPLCTSNAVYMLYSNIICEYRTWLCDV